MSAPWTRSQNVSIKRTYIDTLLFRVDVIDMSFRQQSIQSHVQIKRFLAYFVRLQNPDFLHFLEIFCCCLASCYPLNSLLTSSVKSE
jgi:hypothetical protein